VRASVDSRESEGLELGGVLSPSVDRALGVSSSPLSSLLGSLGGRSSAELQEQAGNVTVSEAVSHAWTAGNYWTASARAGSCRSTFGAVEGMVASI
jgi:hypothetical protein